MTPLEILTSARASLENPEHWTKGAYFRDGQGVARGPTSNDPDFPQHIVSTCAVGALMYAHRGAVVAPLGPIYDEEEFEDFYKARSYIKWVIRWVYKRNDTVVAWNDRATHAEVLDCFDKAIEKCRDKN